jgi:hypothetical protein
LRKRSLLSNLIKNILQRFLIILIENIAKMFFINNIIKKHFSQTFLIVLTKNVAKTFLLKKWYKNDKNWTNNESINQFSFQ